MGDINLELDASWWWWPVSSCAPRRNHKPHTPPNWYRLISQAYPTYLYQVLSQVYPNHIPMTLANCPHHLTLPQWSWRQEQLLSGSAENIERGGHIPFLGAQRGVLINGDLLGFESSLIGTSWDLVGVLITHDESLLNYWFKGKSTGCHGLFAPNVRFSWKLSLKPQTNSGIMTWAGGIKHIHRSVPKLVMNPKYEWYPHVSIIGSWLHESQARKIIIRYLTWHTLWLWLT